MSAAVWWWHYCWWPFHFSQSVFQATIFWSFGLNYQLHTVQVWTARLHCLQKFAGAPFLKLLTEKIWRLSCNMYHISMEMISMKPTSGASCKHFHWIVPRRTPIQLFLTSQNTLLFFFYKNVEFFDWGWTFLYIFGISASNVLKHVLKYLYWF